MEASHFPIFLFLFSIGFPFSPARFFLLAFCVNVSHMICYCIELDLLMCVGAAILADYVLVSRAEATQRPPSADTTLPPLPDVSVPNKTEDPVQNQEPEFVELPANELKTPPLTPTVVAITDDASSDKGKQRDTEHVHIITAHPDSEKEDERGWKAPEVTAEVGDWHVVEKTDDLLAASPSSSSEIDTKGKETAISHGEEVVAAIPEALTTKPAPPTRNLQDEEVHVQKAPKNELIIPPLPAPRNLDEEAASPEVPKDDVSVIIQDIAKALDTPITPEAEERIRTPELAEPVIEDVTVVSQSSKGADTPLVQEVSVVEELTEVITPPVEELVAEDVPAPALSPVTQSPAVTQPPVITEPAPSIESAVVIQLPAVIEPTVVTQPPIVTEPIPAAQPGIEVPKSQEVEVEPVVEAGPSIQKPEGAVSIKTPEFKTPTAEQKSPELVPPTTEALPTVPVIPVESDGEEESSPAAGIVIPIVPLVPVVPEKEADVEPAKPQEEPEEIAPGQGPYIPADDEDSDNDVIRGPEAQIMHIPTPITPVDEIEEPQAPKVTEPKPETEVIPPPTLTHSGTSETSPDVVTAFPVVDGVVQIGGTPVEEQVPIDQSPAILPPIPNLPRDVIEDLTPTPPAEVSPPPIPPQRNLQDEERPPSLTVELPPAAESPQNVSPVKTKPEFPEFGVSAPVEEQRPRTHPHCPSPKLPFSLADIREELEPEDVPQAIVPPVAREEPLMISLPLTPEVINPVDTIKLIAPSAGSAAPSIRKISDEMADEKPEEPEKHTEIVEDKGKGVADDVESDDGNWVSKYKETGPEEVPSPAEEVAPRPVTPPTKVTSDEPETPSTPPTPLSPSDSAENAHKGADSASTKEKTGIRGRLTRTLSIGRKDKEVGDMRPGTSHSTTISVHSTDDRKSIAESTKRRGSTARALMGFGRKDKKEKDPEQMTNSEAMLAAGAGKAPSIKSVKGATSEPVSPPPVQRKTRDLMKLAIGKSKKKESESVPASPVEGSSTPPTPQTPRKGLSMSNAVNLMMLRKKAQDEKVKSAEAAAAAAAAAAAKASPPPTPAVEASSSVPTATVPAESASAPATPSTPTTAEIPAAAAEAAEAAEPAKPAPLKRRNTLTMNNAVNLMMLRKKAKEEAKEERPETAPSTPSAPAAIESAIDDSAPAQETPPPPPRRRNTITMGKAVDLMMLRKGKEKDDNSGPDADSSASPKKDKRMSMGAMFGRKKSAPNTPTLGGSNSRPTTPLTPGALFKSTMSLAGPDNEAVGPHDTANETPLASPLKPPSRAPSVHERPGTSASTRAFHNPFKKRTPSVYSHDIPDSSTPFNGPNSPFPSANGTDRPSLSHTESSPAIFPPSPTKNSDGEAEEVKPKTSRRLSMAFKPFSKLNNVEAAAGPSGQGDSQRPPTSASMPLGEKGATTGGSVSTSGTSGTVPGAPAAGSVPAEKEKRPRLGARAKTMMAFGGKKK